MVQDEQSSEHSVLRGNCSEIVHIIGVICTVHITVFQVNITLQARTVQTNVLHFPQSGNWILHFGNISKGKIDKTKECFPCYLRGCHETSKMCLEMPWKVTLEINC